MATDAARFHLLTVPPAREAAEQCLLPEVRTWFATTFGAPTLAQRFAWPASARGEHLLLSSPTGTGKTLAAFLPIINGILAEPGPGLRCLYIAPLKALGRDVNSNLKRAWRSIREGASPLPSPPEGRGENELRIGLRTGDTSQRVRMRQNADPPSILLTTPESLAQMLTQPSAGDLFRHLRHVVVDEIHALVANKRGADLAVSLERLDVLTEHASVQRIGLSATCAPLADVAEFLVGSGRTCAIAQVSDPSVKRFLIEPLFENLEYSPSWLAALLDRIDAEISIPQLARSASEDGPCLRRGLVEKRTARTTLIFTNTRSLAERVTWALRRRYPNRADEIAAHHSSLSAARRRVVERSLKQGRLWIVVSSASLELGIDIGTVDSVVFVHPPGGVVRLLQRVGRSGHRPEQPKRGILLTASACELLEATVTASSGRAGQIEPVRVIEAPLDVLCQQIVGMAMTGLWSPTAAYELIRRARPYRDLGWDDFQDCLDYLSGRLRDGTPWLPARLHWEGDCFTIADSRTAKLLRRNLGTILTEDACTIRLRVPADPTEAPSYRTLGEVDDVYAERLQPGDRFVLDGRCLEMREREATSLVVDEAFGRPAIPRWLGSGVPMSVELARRIYLFRVLAGETLRDGDAALRSLLANEFELNDLAIGSLTRYFLEQETVSEIPTLTTLLIECVTMQSCIEYFVHTPLPRCANETLARVLVHRLRTGAKVLAVTGDLGIYLMAFTAEPMGPERWRENLRGSRFADDFREHLVESDLLPNHFTRVAQTGLMVLRNPAGRKRKVGGKDWTARRLYEQIRERAADFLLLRQTEREAAEGLCDLPTARAFVEGLSALTIRVRHLAQPSPFGESLSMAHKPAAPARVFVNEPVGQP